MVTDQFGNQHRGAGAPGGSGGQFVGKANTSPQGDLSEIADLPTYESEGGGVRVGDVILLELDDEDGPFSFAFRRDTEFRDLWERAGRPERVGVVAVGRVPDEPSDVGLTLQFGEQTHELTLHYERGVTLVDRDA